MSATIIRADARSLPLRDASVDLIVTSPPYFGLRSYRDAGEHYAGQLGGEQTPGAYINELIGCTREMVRVLKPEGSIWVNLGDKYVSDNRGSGADQKRGTAKWAPTGPRGYVGAGVLPRKSLIGTPWRYALRCIDELGLILRAEVIWSKPNGLPESVTDRVRRSHEQWFHLVKQSRYFSAVNEIRERYSPNKPWGSLAKSGRKVSAATAVIRGTRVDQQQSGLGDSRSRIENPLGRLPGSVWEIPNQPLTVPEAIGVEHFAAFPIEWPRRIILGWSPPGGIVLDPFGGTGTTALAAKALGRRGISIDMSADYCRIARWRTDDPGELARALGVAKPRGEIEGQADLLAHLNLAHIPATERKPA